MPFLDSLWTAMDEAVTLKDCDVYSYKSDGEDDPFGVLAPLQLSTALAPLTSVQTTRSPAFPAVGAHLVGSANTVDLLWLAAPRVCNFVPGQLRTTVVTDG